MWFRHPPGISLFPRKEPRVIVHSCLSVHLIFGCNRFAEATKALTNPRPLSVYRGRVWFAWLVRGSLIPDELPPVASSLSPWRQCELWSLWGRWPRWWPLQRSESWEGLVQTVQHCWCIYGVNQVQRSACNVCKRTTAFNKM